jgi:predicted site-specific integrase-resolvase
MKYTLTNLAKRWGVARTSIWRYAKRGLIPVEVSPRGYIVDGRFAEEVEDYLRLMRGEQRKLYVALLLFRLKKSREAIDEVTGGRR